MIPQGRSNVKFYSYCIMRNKISQYMEVGSVRERIIIALMIYKFGKENVETDIPITKSEIDVKLFAEPISI